MAATVTATTMTTDTAATTSRRQESSADCDNAGAGKQLFAPAGFCNASRQRDSVSSRVV